MVGKNLTGFGWARLVVWIAGLLLVSGICIAAGESQGQGQDQGQGLSPVLSRRHLEWRPRAAALPPGPGCTDGPALSAAEVQDLLDRVISAVGVPLTVAVVDRAGNPLGVARSPGAPPGHDERAVGLARTGAFFSNNQAPLSSRTVRFVSGLHFPPGVARTPNAALYGIEQTNRGCDLQVGFLPGKSLPPARSLGPGPCDGSGNSGCGIGPVTGKTDPFDGDPEALDPGGLPIFRGKTLVGGLGVAVDPAGPVAELAAFQALQGAGLLPDLSGLGPNPAVFIDGVRLPFVEPRSWPSSPPPGPAPPAGVTVLAPADGSCAADGWLAGPTGGNGLSQAEVETLVLQAVDAAQRVRAVIRLPIGSRARMVIAVSDLDGDILGLFRMEDATLFSLDVAVAKARNVVYFSSPAGKAALGGGLPPDTAVSNRTVSFGAQPLYPPGIDGTSPGPFFDLFVRDFQNPCQEGFDPASPRRNGVVFFPGSTPLYRGGLLVGGLGVSGDGVEQDDFVAFEGSQGFRPPQSLRADRLFVRGVRLPFLKLPRNPER